MAVIESRSGSNPTRRCSRFATFSLRAAGTRQLSNVINRAGGRWELWIMSALAHSLCTTPVDSVTRPEYPRNRIGKSGVTSTSATPT
ncbi:hypothetical protein OAF75_03240 [Verrucomicrobiales bacterium]|nr:hypothetical protein [Verrucomicrobiales bacterium]